MCPERAKEYLRVAREAGVAVMKVTEDGSTLEFQLGPDPKGNRPQLTPEEEMEAARRNRFKGSSRMPPDLSAGRS